MNWNALLRLADAVGTQSNPACQIRGANPQHQIVDNGGAQALCIHDPDWTGVITSDGKRHALT